MQYKRKEKHICWENTWTKNGEPRSLY